MATTDALSLDVTWTGNGRSQTDFFIRPSSTQNSWSGTCMQRGRWFSIVTSMDIPENRMPFSMDALTKIMSKKAESKMLNWESFRSCAAKETTYAVWKIAGSVSKNAKRRRQEWWSSERWTLWTHLPSNAHFLAKSGMPKRPPCRKMPKATAGIRSPRCLRRRKGWRTWAWATTGVLERP